jgi:hypothetical protein
MWQVQMWALLSITYWGHPMSAPITVKKTYLILNQSGTFSLTSNTECEKVEMTHLGQYTNKNLETCRVRIVIRVK